MAGEAEGAPEASFEKELENLERVVNLLERGDVDLDEAIRQYESGYRALKRCYQVLESARKRIEILTGGSGSESGEGAGGGPPAWRPVKFPDSPSEEPEALGGPTASG